MKKIFGLALCLALAAGTARAQQYNDGFADQAKPVLTETELTDVVLFTNGRAEKGIVLEVTAGQPVRIIQADGVVHAYSPLLVDRMEILHTAAPALPSATAQEPVESYDDKPDYYEEQHAARGVRRAPVRRAKAPVAQAQPAVRPAARRPLRGVQPAMPRRAQAEPAARLRPARHAAGAEVRPRAARAAGAGAARVPRARGAKRR